MAAPGPRQRLWSRRTYEASGHDMHTLLFSFLDELLFVFSTELFAPKLLDISHFDQGGWHITATGCRPADPWNALVQKCSLRCDEFSRASNEMLHTIKTCCWSRRDWWGAARQSQTHEGRRVGANEGAACGWLCLKVAGVGGARRRGEVFDRQRHVSGTEVKAITYSAMDVRQCDDEVEVFVIVDI